MFFSFYKKKAIFQRPKRKKTKKNMIVETNNVFKLAKNDDDLPKCFNCNLYRHINRNYTKPRQNGSDKGLEKGMGQ